MKIEFENVSCGYKECPIISNLSFSFETGDAICILGANGIGKTTIFKTLIGMLDPLSGSIYIDKREINSLSTKERAMIISYVPQAKNYSYQFTVQDIILMGRASYVSNFRMPKQDDIDIVSSVMEKLNLIKYAYKPYCELSGGEQQMVLLGRAMAQQSKFILLDEPASNLDFYNQKKLLQTIISLSNDGTGVLMVSHAPEHAFRCCKYTLMIIDKENYAFGKTEDIITQNNLRKTYGVDIGVSKIQLPNSVTIHTCYIS